MKPVTIQVIQEHISRDWFLGLSSAIEESIDSIQAIMFTNLIVLVLARLYVRWIERARLTSSNGAI